MKLEVGMYVRTKIGVIGKVISIDKDSHDNDIITIFNGHFHIIHKEMRTEFDILKASHNIIDLIEVGDYVNGLYIDHMPQNPDYKLIWHLSRYGDDDEAFGEKDIKTIVTKEQFESMSYKVVE